MSRDWRLRAEDILAACERARTFLGELDLDAFRADARTASAVPHQIFVIGEAASRLPEDIRQRAPEVPWREIIGMRNVIAHGYFEVDVEVPWKTVRLDLPVLEEAVRRLLEAAA